MKKIDEEKEKEKEKNHENTAKPLNNTIVYDSIILTKLKNCIECLYKDIYDLKKQNLEEFKKTFFT